MIQSANGNRGIKSKEPSEKLKSLISECVSQFSKLEDTLERIKARGLEEGFTPIEIGDIIKAEMINAGYHRSTVARYLPPEFKHIEKARSKFGRILLPKMVEGELTKKDFDTIVKEDVERPTEQPQTLDVRAFFTRDLTYYPENYILASLDYIIEYYYLTVPNAFDGPNRLF